MSIHCVATNWNGQNSWDRRVLEQLKSMQSEKHFGTVWQLAIYFSPSILSFIFFLAAHFVILSSDSLMLLVSYRMTKASFDVLLSYVNDKLVHAPTHRSPISPAERLAITLR